MPFRGNLKLCEMINAMCDSFITKLSYSHIYHAGTIWGGRTRIMQLCLFRILHFSIRLYFMISTPNALQANQLSTIPAAIKYEGSKEAYESALKSLQTSILAIQQVYWHQNKRAIIVFEGSDASGKGGAIRRMTEKLDPRSYSVHPISAPTPMELSQHYLVRFQTRLPAKGKIAIFDRSWYGRVLVERVEAIANTTEWHRAYCEINQFEEMQLADDTRIVKIFMHISADEQLRRFAERLHNPMKRWKLTTEDLRNREKWPDYETAINQMFTHTSTVRSPWHGIPGNHKWYARLAVLQTVVDQLSVGIDITPPPLDPDVIGFAKKQLGL